MNERLRAIVERVGHLPDAEQEALAKLLEKELDHLGLHVKKVDDGDPELWSVRIDRRYRTLGLRRGDWIA